MDATGTVEPHVAVLLDGLVPDLPITHVDGRRAVLVPARWVVQVDSGPSSPPPARSLVVEALRWFRDADRLAALPWSEATGDRARPAAERVRVWRERVVSRLDEVFVDDPSDRGLRLLLERAYVAEDGGHRVAQRELCMSRSTYYRRLQQACDRVDGRTRHS